MEENKTEIKNEKNTGALAFIFVALFLDVMGLGIIIPVFPKLIANLIHGDLSTAALWGGWLVAAFAIMQFLFSPIMGGLSDRYGRRPVLLLSLLGFGLDYLVMAFAPTIWWLFGTRVVAGMMGASFTTGTAYIADISTPEKRAQNFGIIGMAFGLGFMVGPALGGILGKDRYSLAIYSCSMCFVDKCLVRIFYSSGIVATGTSPQVRLEAC